ncbi:MAG: HEAT repeat domain-containing protein [bacterium]
MTRATALAVVGLSCLVCGEARGDRVHRPTRLLEAPDGELRAAEVSRVGRLIRQLHHASPKVRLVAILRLRREPEPRVVGALVTVLGRSKELPVIRGYAADALARLGAGQSIPALRAAIQTGGSFVRARAKRALTRLCPTEWLGRHFFVDLTKVRSRQAALANVARFYLGRLLARHREIVVGWPGCRRPTSGELRKHNVWAYSLDAAVKTRRSDGRLGLGLSLRVTSQPGQEVRSVLSAQAQVAGTADSATLTSVVQTLSWRVESDLHRFLFLRPCRSPRSRPDVTSPAVAVSPPLGAQVWLPRRSTPLGWRWRMRRKRMSRDLLRADRLARSGAWSQSHAVLQKAIARDPTNLDARRRLGALQVRLGDYSGALRTIEWIRHRAGEREADRIRRELQASVPR